MGIEGRVSDLPDIPKGLEHSFCVPARNRLGKIFPCMIPAGDWRCQDFCEDCTRLKNMRLENPEAFPRKKKK